VELASEVDALSFSEEVLFESIHPVQTFKNHGNKETTSDIIVLIDFID